MDAVTSNTRRVEYLGLPSPYAYPDVQKMIATAIRSSGDQRKQDLHERALVRRELRKQESKRQMQGFARVQGHSQLTLGPDHGLSRTYVWGPQIWTVEMDAHDIEILMSMHPAHRQAFRLVDNIVVVRA
ncbi:MAG: hypothetical protein ACR2OE_09500 [Thermomicrobiales bacterium]